MQNWLKLLLLFVCSNSLGQDNNGLIHSNYSPVNTVFVNPASIVDSKTYLDINILGGASYVHSGPLFFPGNQIRFWNFFAMNKKDTPSLIGGTKKNSGYAKAIVHGPSFSLSLGKNAIGFKSAFRMMADAKDIPVAAITYGINGWKFPGLDNKQYLFQDLRVNILAFSEYGITFSRNFYSGKPGILSGGISVKYLVGHGHAGMKINEMRFQTIDDQYDIYNLKGNYNFTLPSGNAGNGWGFDLGVMFRKTFDDETNYIPHNRNRRCEYAEYRYKIGFSVLDIGSIKMKNGATRRGINLSSPSSFTLDQFQVPGIEKLDSSLHQYFLGTSASLASGSEYSVMLPTAISFQFDVNCGNNFYIGSHWIHGFQRKVNMGVARSGSIAVVPRFETKRFEIAMPFTYQDYNHVSAGLAIRYSGIYVGSDKLGTVFSGKEVNGMDFYAGYRVTIFDKMGCGDSYKRISKYSKRRTKTRRSSAYF